MYSRVSYTGDGSTSEFTIPFPYLRIDTLEIRSSGVLRTLGTDYTVDTSTGKVVFTAPPPSSAPVQIKRVTPRGANQRVVVFTDPSDIRAEILNSADLQLLYILQEALDDIADGIGVGELITASGTTTPRPLSDRFAETLNVLDFGAVGDGTADDTAAIQAALSAATTAGGGSVHFPAGVFKVSAPLVLTGSNVTITGQGRATRIQTNHATANILELGNGTSEIRNIRVADITLYSSVTKTDGACVYARKLCRSSFHNVYLSTPELYNTDGNRLCDGFHLAEFDSVSADGVYGIVNRDGVIVYGNSSQTFGAEFYLTGNSRILRARYGIHIAGGAGGVDLGNCDVSLCEHGVRVSDDLGGAYNRELFIGSEFSTDANQTNAGRGILFRPNSVVYAEVSGAWVASNDVGIEIMPGQPSGAAFKFQGVRIYNQRETGIIINDGQVILDGCFVALNGQGASGGHGIWKSAASDKQLIVSNNVIANNGSAGVGYGVVIVPGCDNFNIEGNNFAGNTQGPLLNGSSVGVTKLVRNNLGLLTENNGTAQITAGNSSVTVAHGLHDTPTAVSVSFAGPQDAGVHVYSAPVTYTGTQFTITLSSPATVTRDFTWRATRGPQ